MIESGPNGHQPIEVLGVELIETRGNYPIIRKYLRGYHPELGDHHLGLQGEETIVEEKVIIPENFYG